MNRAIKNIISTFFVAILMVNPVFADNVDLENTYKNYEYTKTQSIDDFISIFNNQFQIYNTFANRLWYDNAVVDKIIILHDIDTDRFFKFVKNEKFIELSDEEFNDFEIERITRAGAFDIFKNDDISGMYITTSNESLNNSERWKIYTHLGTYDAILWFIHEGFHAWEQPRWNLTDGDIPNSARNEFLENTYVRAVRYQLTMQLLQALSDPENQEQHILNALATYSYFKENFVEEHELSIYFDRLEGSAYFFEVMASLIISNYEILIEDDCFESALFNIITDFASTGHSAFSAYGLGLVSEGYTTSGFAALLLERIGIHKWQQMIMEDAYLTPMQVLFNHFSQDNIEIPDMIQITDETLLYVKQSILSRYQFLLQRQHDILDLLGNYL
ncbi:MAG: hypothetical protein FWF57_01545 [Defluviitaleaceae bacterium]|nr:hypothetical protein [Defluviitaleaceae bacterium]